MFAGLARRGARWLLSVRSLGALFRRDRVAAGALMAVMLAASADLAYGQEPVASATASPTVSAPPSPGVEDAQARTETSQTFTTTAGERVTRFHSGPVNYLDDVGRWQPIDNNLRLEDGRVRNGAAGYTASLPTNLAEGDVLVQREDAWVSFSPRISAKSSAPRLEGPTARYPEVWPGVDAVYTVTGSGLREDFVVSRLEAVPEFVFAVRASDGLRAQLHESGVISFVDAEGRAKLTMPAAYMFDARGQRDAVRSELSASADGWTVTLQPDREWLAAPQRAWPVTIDPQVSAFPQSDCTIYSADRATSYCGDGILKAGADSYGNFYHALMSFDFDSGNLASLVGPGVEIRSAELYLWNLGTSSNTQDIAASRIVQRDEWINSTGGFTWNSFWGTVYDEGDMDAYTRIDDVTTVDGGDVGWTQWNIAGMVRRWASGQENFGLMLRSEVPFTVATDDPPSFAESDAGFPTAPYLEVTYSHRGVRRGYAWDGYQITDRSSMAVNVADGNLLLTSQDLAVTGTGLDLSMTRYYNTQDGEAGELGTGGRFSLGRDIEMDECDLRDHPNSRCMTTARGIHVQFKRDSNGDFESPPSMKTSRLEENNDNTFTLTDRSSGTKMHFNSGAQSYMSSMEDKHGNLIDPDYVTGSSGYLTKVTDTQGREFDVSANGNGDITEIEDPYTDPPGTATTRKWVYAYHSGTRRLASVTNPANETTLYGYDSGGRLQTITDPNGTAITIAYDSRLRVTSITRPGTSNTADNAVTTYDYSHQLTGACTSVDKADGQTLVTDPRGKVTRFCWDDRGRVLRTVDADGNKRGRQYNQQDDVDSYTELEGAAAKEFQFDSTGPSNRLVSGNAPEGESFEVGYCGESGEPTCKNNDLDTFAPTSVERTNAASSYMEYTDKGDLRYTGPQREGQSSGPDNTAQLSWRDGDGETEDDGQLKWSEDGRGNRTNYSYDVDGNLIGIDPPGSKLKPTTFTVDDVSRISSVRDGRHDSGLIKQVESIVYDGVDRVTRINYGDDSRFEYDYDANGNLVARADFADQTTTTPIHATAYTYNLRNERTTESFDPGTAFNAYVWDKAGNLVQFQDASGTVTYGYDDINRVTSITEPSTAVIGISHNDDARTTTAVYPGGIQHITRTDKSGKTTSIRILDENDDQLRLLDYDYVDGDCEAPVGQRSQLVSYRDENNQANTHRLTCYGYDILDRLIEAETRNGQDGSGSLVDHWIYDRDGAGNRIYKSDNNGSSTTETTYAYGDANELCWRHSGDHRVSGGPASCTSEPSGATMYTHDDSGNETEEDPGRDASYDIRNRMVEINGKDLDYLTATNADLIAFDSESYVNTLLGIGSNTGTSYTRNPDNSAALGQRSSTSTEYLLADRLGSTIGLITASSDDIDRTYQYTPDGQANGPSTGTGAGTELRYAGGHLIDGLYHFGARYYDPENARWTQQDPLNAPGDLRNANRYLYVGGDPINNVDPSGLLFDGWFDGTWFEDHWDCANPVSTSVIQGTVTGATVGFAIGYWSAVTDLGGWGATGVGLVSGGVGAVFGNEFATYSGCYEAYIGPLPW